MSNPVFETYTPKLMTGSALVYTGACKMCGFSCATTSSGTVIIYDGTSATGAVSGTYTLTAGQFYAFPATLNTGLYIAIANTASITVFWTPA